MVAANTAPRQQDPGRQLPAEARKTAHRLIAAFDRDRRHLDAIHKDLFQSDSSVVLSALSALAEIKDRRSLQFVARLASQEDRIVQPAAVAALGAMGFVGATKVLLGLFELSTGDRAEPVRQACLSALARLAPEDPGVEALLRKQALSHLVSAETRAVAVEALLRIEGAEAAREMLALGEDLVLRVAYSVAGDHAAVAGAVLEHGATHAGELATENRERLVRLASASRQPASIRLLIAALDDPAPEVRKAAYEAIGVADQKAHFPAITARLSAGADPSPVLEDDALAAIERIQSVADADPEVSCGRREEIYAQIRSLFAGLSAEDRRVASDSHDLGWAIARSREYLEYYADEELRQSVVGYLRGSANYDTAALQVALKRSAVKVEVRHFDGYTALCDLFKNPRRSGIGLVARELAIAKLGKRALLYRLIRNVRLATVFGTAGLKVDAVALFLELYEWGRKNKIFRLAEAALCTLARLDHARAAECCLQCLSPPISSKICAIASLRLIKDFEWAPLQPAVLTLMSESSDEHILLNVADALANNPTAATAETVEAMVALFRRGPGEELTQRVAAFLARHPSLDLQGALSTFYDAASASRKLLILGVFHSWAADGRAPSREGLVEFLYRILRRQQPGAERARAAVLLWCLGDDYAARLLAEIATGGSIQEKTEMLLGIKGSVRPDLAPVFRALMAEESAAVQEALAAAMISASGDTAALLDATLSTAEEPRMEESAAEDTGDLKVDLSREKKSYRFENEYVQELAVFFSDIVGYSKKAQILSSMDLAALIREYEGILLPLVASHRGELIKKMGDGHLFVFDSALNAALAAVRLQKSLKRFNGYREERLRVLVRIGVHWGKVVRRDGDVLGNHVNIASRLETSAKAGSVLVSETVHARLEGLVLAEELEPIQVKNIAEPIKVYEPSEIALDLPADKDPLKAPPPTPADAPAAAVSGVGGPGADPSCQLSAAAAGYLVETFSALNALCHKVERHQVAAVEIRKELSRRWARLRGAVEAARVPRAR